MISPATNRQVLLELARATLEALHDAPSSPEAIDDVHPDAVKNSLEAALDWARLEGATTTEESVARTVGAEPYIPYNQTLSLLQSAYEEYVESRGVTELPFDPNDPNWKTIAEEKIKATARGKHPFIPHRDLDSFRYDLPDDAAHSFRIGARGKQRRNASCSRSLQRIRLMPFILETSIIPELRKSHGSTSLTSSSSMVRRRTPVVISRWRETMTTTVADMAILTLSFPLYDRKRVTLICGTINGRSSGWILVTRNMVCRILS
jgi:hypothetical protein